MSIIFIPLLNSWILCWRRCVQCVLVINNIISVVRKLLIIILVRKELIQFSVRMKVDKNYSAGKDRHEHNEPNLICSFNPVLMLTGIKIQCSFWIIIVNWMIGFLLMNIWYFVDFYMIEVVNMRLNSLSWCTVVVILLVSSCVILCSIDYLSVLDSAYFLLLVSLFQFVMLTFVISNDLIITIVNWDWLGLISYLLINFWASKTKSGIKAVVYNQVGDLSFLMIIAFSYSVMPLINYSPFLSFSMLNSMLLFYPFFLKETFIVSLSLILIFFSKSAMLPLSSWLNNAMAAPTPVSSLLHSSTMVIAGVYLSLLMQPIITLSVDSFVIVVIILLVVPIYSLIWSVFKAISLSDIKSAIAFSTISQISYMFLAFYCSSILVLFHIIIHAVFKSILFLISGSLIHSTSNFQSIYKMKITLLFIKLIYIIAGSILIISLSKEFIIISSSFILSSIFIPAVSILGSVGTALYTIKIFYYVFSMLSIHSFTYLSFYLPWFSITAIILDQTLDYFFSLSSIVYYHYSYLLLIDWILDFSLVIIILSGLIWIDLNMLSLFQYPFFYYFIFSSRTTFYINPFEYFYLLYSSFYFKGMIYLVEVYTGMNSYSLYHIYYSSYLLLCFFPFILLFIFLYLFIYLSFYFLYLYLLILLFSYLYLFIFLFIYLFIFFIFFIDIFYIFIYLFFYLFIYLYFYLFIFLFILLFIYYFFILLFSCCIESS